MPESNNKEKSVIISEYFLTNEQIQDHRSKELLSSSDSKLT